MTTSTLSKAKKRITLTFQSTPELERILDMLENKYPTLNRTEIVKLALAEFADLVTTRQQNEGNHLTEEDKADIHQARQDYANGDYVTLRSEEDIREYFDNLV